jgi:hypothetical protein
MALEYKTYQFTQDMQGLAGRDDWIRQMSAHGYRIASETVEPGHIMGGQACCLSSLCLPCGFLAARTPAIVSVTFVRDDGNAASDAPSLHSSATAAKLCPHCKNRVAAGAKFCIHCGKSNAELN